MQGICLIFLEYHFTIYSKIGFSFGIDLDSTEISVYCIGTIGSVNVGERLLDYLMSCVLCLEVFINIGNVYLA